MTLADVLNELYRRELNCGLQSFWDAGWTVWIGDPLNGVKMQAQVDTIDEAAVWLFKKAAELEARRTSENKAAIRRSTIRSVD